jgi:hypothetical protein
VGWYLTSPFGVDMEINICHSSWNKILCSLWYFMYVFSYDDASLLAKAS